MLAKTLSALSVTLAPKSTGDISLFISDTGKIWTLSVQNKTKKTLDVLSDLLACTLQVKGVSMSKEAEGLFTLTFYDHLLFDVESELIKGYIKADDS